MVGKPAEFMLANIASAFGLKRSQICMVGDRLDTDILFGQQGGLSTMLVLSGELPNGPSPTHLDGSCLLAVTFMPSSMHVQMSRICSSLHGGSVSCACDFESILAARTGHSQ